jgi:hypothetical protein
MTIDNDQENVDAVPVVCVTDEPQTVEAEMAEPIIETESTSQVVEHQADVVTEHVVIEEAPIELINEDQVDQAVETVEEELISSEQIAVQENQIEIVEKDGEYYNLILKKFYCMIIIFIKFQRCSKRNC